jgi:hypothetical protein
MIPGNPNWTVVLDDNGRQVIVVFHYVVLVWSPNFPGCASKTYIWYGPLKGPWSNMLTPLPIRNNLYEKNC